jgi:hypothetical protein
MSVAQLAPGQPDPRAPNAAVKEAQDAFSDQPPGPIIACNPGDSKSPSKKPKWTSAEIKAQLDKCDGGTGVWAAAKAANGGKDPVVKPGNAATGGQVDTDTGEITLDENQDPCIALQVQIQELTNLSHKSDFDKASTSAFNGDLSREDFIRAYEHAEYDGVHNVIKAFDACKDTWGCKTCEKEWARKYKNFDEYYKGMSTAHKENYGKWWDSNCKSKYDAKHS